MAKNNSSRLLTLGALSHIGAELTIDRDFGETAARVLQHLCRALAAREGAVFAFSDSSSLLISVASAGYSSFPASAFIPLLPTQIRALVAVARPVIVKPESVTLYLTTNGNVAPEMFRCVAPLCARGRLVGMLALGPRDRHSSYHDEELEIVGTIANYLAVAVQNHTLSQALQQRVAENLRLLNSLHKFYDNAVEAFSAAIDLRQTALHNHSVRVGRFAAGIASTLGFSFEETLGMQAAGYLHDIGKVAIPETVGDEDAPNELRGVVDHTIIGHRIVSGIDFPWHYIPEVVRSHHERADGSGYPDGLKNQQIPLSARIVAVADAFETMTAERAPAQFVSVGSALAELVRLTPNKFDADVMHSLLVQVRRDTTGSNKEPFLENGLLNIGAGDVDQLNSILRLRVEAGNYDA